LQEFGVWQRLQPGQRLGWPGAEGHQVAQDPISIGGTLIFDVSQDGLQGQQVAVNVGKDG